MKYIKAFILTIIVFYLFFFSIANAQTVVYQGKSYSIQTGSRGGQFILLQDSTKHYLARDPVVESGGSAMYQGKSYPIQTGSRGGRYFIVNGTKHYLPRKQ